MVPFSDERALTRQDSGIRMNLYPLSSCDARVDSEVSVSPGRTSRTSEERIGRKVADRG